jgi:uncharacterized protein
MAVLTKMIDKNSLIVELNILASEIMSNLPMHDHAHTMEVFRHVTEYARKESLTDRQTFNLQMTALLHDIIYAPGAVDNKEKSAAFAEAFLKHKGLGEQDIQEIKRLILATKDPHDPKDDMEKILFDSLKDPLENAFA